MNAPAKIRLNPVTHRVTEISELHVRNCRLLATLMPCRKFADKTFQFV